MRRNLLIILLFLVSTIIVSLDGQAQKSTAGEQLTCEGPQETSEPGRQAAMRDVVDKVKLLCVYSIKDGKLQPTVLMKEDIEREGRLKVEGHVCGIVVLCEEDMAVSVEGQTMSKIKKNPDGTLSAKGYGKLPFQESALLKTDGLSFEKPKDGKGAKKEDEAFLAGGYSFFPWVTGDSVAQESAFHITFKTQAKTFELPVQQDGYRTLRTVRLRHDSSSDGITFRYVGARLKALENRSTDLDMRLSAIAEGIDAVERTFEMSLVSQVNIIDFEDIHDAVTCDSGNEIWFYANALLKEPIDELRSMAEHESLHKLVRKKGLTMSAEVRELFADLKGYDDFSHERFMLVMTGNVPAQRSNDATSSDPFFAFINESNFIEGMKGGHSHANIDEFCTSFMHSLMYVDVLDQNLKKPLSLYGKGRQSRLLAAEERVHVSENYLKMVQILIKADAGAEERSGALSRDLVGVLLRQGLKKAQQVRKLAPEIKLSRPSL